MLWNFDDMLSLTVITWYALFTIWPKYQQRIAIVAECEVSFSRFLLMHTCILYCWSDRPILCGNFIEFDEKKCLYSKSFRFNKHLDLSEKNIGCLAHPKIFVAKYPLLANADKTQKYKIERFSRTGELLLLTVWKRPQEQFNHRNFLVWPPYTPTFDIIPYTLKTLERYFLDLIKHIQVCGSRSKKAFWGWFTRQVALISLNDHTINLSVHTRNKKDNSWHIVNLNIVNWGTSHLIPGWVWEGDTFSVYRS